jgi:peptidoglycan hydrolase-like protein with peptidoglycan-binding domain
MKKRLIALAPLGVLVASVAFAGAETGKETAPAAATEAAQGPKAGPPATFTPETIKAVQGALRDHGYEPGPIDGVAGPRTEAALRAFQVARGLEETGRIDFATMGKLGVEPSLL